MTESTKARIENIEGQIHREIPLSAHMGIKVKKATDQHVQLWAPLGPNTNHKSTAFGGSVYSVAVLSCWSLVSSTLKDAGFNFDYVVVQDGQMEYFAPVTGDFDAESSWRSESEKSKFFQTVSKKGLGRATLTSIVRSRNQECARLEARFAVQVIKG